MKSIYKYTLTPAEMQNIELPEGAEILTTQTQNGEICIWAMVNPDAKKVIRTFTVIGTGWRIITESNLKYIGTVQLEGGALVFHVFEWVSKEGPE